MEAICDQQKTKSFNRRGRNPNQFFTKVENKSSGKKGTSKDPEFGGNQI